MNKPVLIFQFIFWIVAAVLLFLYGLSYGHWEVALVRNLYLPVIGFLLSWSAVPVYSHSHLDWDYRSFVIVALICSLAALITALVVNPITFALLGEELTAIPRADFLTDMLYFVLFYLVWSLLYLYRFGDKGEKVEKVESVDGKEGSEHEESASVVIVESRGEIRKLALKDLECVRASDDYIELVTAAQSYLKKETLTNFENQLSPDRFVRVHRGAIVNREHVESVKPLQRGTHEITLRSGLKIKSSRSYNDNIAMLIPSA